MTNSRQKGAAFENRIAGMLFQELGITFRRDLDQYRQRDRGDLIPDDDAFPFLVECKKTKDALTSCRPSWWRQAHTAAGKADKLPVVIWATDRRPVRCTVDLSDVMDQAFPAGHLVDVSFDTFCLLAREAM